MAYEYTHLMHKIMPIPWRRSEWSSDGLTDSDAGRLWGGGEGGRAQYCPSWQGNFNGQLRFHLTTEDIHDTPYLVGNPAYSGFGPCIPFSLLAVILCCLNNTADVSLLRVSSRCLSSSSNPLLSSTMPSSLTWHCFFLHLQPQQCEARVI